MAVLYEIWMLWYCSIFTTSAGSALAVEDHSVTRDWGGWHGGTIHMSCFYSNCWPGGWVSDNCLLTTLLKPASCWMPSNAAAKLRTSASKKRCWGRDEAPLLRDRLSFLCCSVFCLSEKWALPSALRLEVAVIPKLGCQIILDLIGSDLFVKPCLICCKQ